MLHDPKPNLFYEIPSNTNGNVLGLGPINQEIENHNGITVGIWPGHL